MYTYTIRKVNRTRFINKSKLKWKSGKIIDKKLAIISEFFGTIFTILL